MVVRVGDDDATYAREKTELRTYVTGETPPAIKPLTFSSTLDMPVQQLKEVIKKARKWHAELIRIQVKYVKDATQAAPCFITLSINGDCDYSLTTCGNVDRQEDGSLIIKPSEDDQVWNVDEAQVDMHFDGLFIVDKIDSFVKCLPSRVAKAYVKQGMPILFDYDMGYSNGSYIRFLVASSTEDD